MLMEIAGVSLLSQRFKGWLRMLGLFGLASLIPPTAKAMDDLSFLTRLVQRDGEAEAVLPALMQAVREKPDDARQWAWLGYALCLRGDWQGARQAYERARSLAAPFNLAWLPPQLPLDWLKDWQGMGQAKWASTAFWWSLPAPTAPVSFTLAQAQRPFPYLIAIYADEGRFARQWVRWLMTSEQLPPHLRTAPLVFAWALREFANAFGTKPKLPVTVWLFPEGDGRAETMAGNTHFFGLAPFDRFRWWLKVAHEAGHHTIPAFGPFDGWHEPYSGGFLGERLFALWLWDGQDDSPMDAEVAQGLLRFLRSQVIPEIVAGQQWLLRSSEEPPSMPTFLGICAYLERVAGRKFLRSAMEEAGGDDWRAFRRGICQAIEKALKDGLTLRFPVPDANTLPATFDPQGLKAAQKGLATQFAWWLPTETFQGQLQVQGNGELVMRWGEREIGRWRLSSSLPVSLPLRWTVTEARWQRLRFWWVQGAGQVLSLTLKRSDDGQGEGR
ncbi:MAG: hypothetical protein SLRJCFUN_002633 [Candidatus Fervidibacter sp.]